jgi:tRNA pseudouridine55 synthase
VVVDKPPGLTSHDVVARVRRLTGTRRVGHAGTLDPMATGVLLVGVGRATRLLGHLALHDKDYLATIRLGQTTTTDDAEGEVVATRPFVTISPDDVAAAAARFVGEIDQRPPAVSALKVAGKRAYARARAGEDVVLPPRRVRVTRFAVSGLRGVFDPAGEAIGFDVDAAVTCSSGTYVRALARDLGEALGVGGHLVALRRTRVGDFDLARARPLADLERSFELVPLDDVAARAFPRRDLVAADAAAVAHGARLSPSGIAGPVAAFGPDGTFLALLEDRDGLARPVAVFTE